MDVSVGRFQKKGEFFIIKRLMVLQNLFQEPPAGTPVVLRWLSGRKVSVFSLMIDRRDVDPLVTSLAQQLQTGRVTGVEGGGSSLKPKPAERKLTKKLNENLPV